MEGWLIEFEACEAVLGSSRWVKKYLRGNHTHIQILLKKKSDFWHVILFDMSRISGATDDYQLIPALRLLKQAVYPCNLLMML